MKCLYYLSPTIASLSKITDDLHKAGIDDWFIHVMSKDEAGLTKNKIHSSNYIEQLDILRFGIIGAIGGLAAGLLAAYWFYSAKPFGPDVSVVAYYAIVLFFSLFGAWEGGLTGIATENKKISHFHDDLENGKNLVMIYAKKDAESVIGKIMSKRHPEAELAAIDSSFYNPLTGPKRI